MKRNGKSRILVQAVMASSFFLAPPLANATLINVPTLLTQLTSSTSDNILEMTPNGSITGLNLFGVKIDTNGGMLIIDPNNKVGANAIQTLGVLATVAGVEVTQPNGVIKIGPGSGFTNTNILPGTDVIFLNNAANGLISNYGSIINNGVGSGSAIQLLNSSNTVINNGTGGLIQTTGVVLGNTILQDVGSIGLDLTNAGTIMQTAALDSIQLNGPFASITNNAGGLITQTGGGTFSVLNINGGGKGPIINNVGAVISAATGSVNAISINTLPYSGNITNAGTISSINGSAILINKSLTGVLNNSGTIVSNNPTTATILTGPVLLSGGILNSGIIQSKGASPAINLAPSFATLTQSGGSILGDVFLASGDSNGILGPQNLFFLNGGSIVGDVTAATFASNNNILALNAGTLDGLLTLGNNGDIVNLNGTQILGGIQGGVGNDTINVFGGNFTLIDGGIGLDTLNILNSFTPNGIINNIDIINVKNVGTVLTLLNPVNNLNNLLTIDPGTTLNLATNIAGKGGILNNGVLNIVGSPVLNFLTGPGTVTNNGLTILNNNDVLNITSNAVNAFSNNPGSVLQIFGDVTNNGLLLVNSNQVGAVNLLSGSFIQPIITGAIANGSTFEIIKVIGGGTIIANNTLIQPISAILSFTQNLNLANNILSLTLNRVSLISLSSSQVTVGIANLIDNLINLNININLIKQIEMCPTPQAVEDALESLIPPFNYGLVAGSHLGMDSTFEGVQSRLEDLQKNRRKVGHLVEEIETQEGTSFGDLARTGSLWVKGLGANLNQKFRQGIHGYKAKGGGVAIGADWGFNDCTTFGLAASYTKVNVDDKSPSPKDQDIKSWQGTAYGWWEFCEGLYVDGMLGIGSNRYKNNRVIHVNDIFTGVQASFDGTQYGAQGDFGWSFVDCDTYYFAPFMRLKYIHLKLDDYTENGDLGLHVSNRRNNEFMGGIGFKTGALNQRCDALIVPELTALLAYDFTNDGEQTLANFTIGTPAFETNGIPPGRTIFDLGLGLRAHAFNSIFSLKYDLVLRSKFTANSIYLQYNYLWC